MNFTFILSVPPPHSLIGDASAWGCCPGSVLFTQLSACRQLSTSACSLSPRCMLHGGACLPTPQDVARVVFAAEAESASGGHSVAKEALGGHQGGLQWASAADLAHALLGMPRQCATMGVEECGAYGAAELDPKRLSSYSTSGRRGYSLPATQSLAAVAENELYSDPSVCTRAAARAAEDLVDSELVEPGVQQVLIEERPQEDEDVVF